MLRTRIATAAIALPALLLLVCLSPDVLFSVAVGLCTAWGLFEVGTMAAADGMLAAGVLGAAGVMPALLILRYSAPSALLAAAVVAALFALTAQVAMAGEHARLPKLLLLAAAALYVGVLFPYFALLRNLPGGVVLFLLMMLIVMATDSGAYGAGRLWGRRKLMPRVSPGKTIEGALGGLVAGVAAGLVLGYGFGVGWGAGKLAVFAAIVSLAGQAGDLCESALKRLFGVKDSGWLFPGHGGLLDRADSLVLAATFTYYYVR